MVPAPPATAHLLLHAGAHAAEASSSFEWWYVAASVGIVGGVGGMLYWYLGERAGLG